MFEIGPGHGTLGELAVAAGWQYTAVETSPFLIDVLRKKGLQVLESWTPPFPMADASADVVYADQILEHMRGIDDARQFTSEALRSLKASGLDIVMLTGDNRTTAEAVARSLGLDDVRAEVLPAQKRDVVRELQSRGKVVAMAGDGINDAPALAEATVGIAMGTGTDVAMESAGITLVQGDLRGIARARRLSRATMRNIRQNLFLAFVYNALGVPVAAGLLYPFTGTLISPIWASAAMTFSSVSVIVNALRLRRLEL